MPTSSNHIEISLHCCHGKHMVARLRTLLSDFVFVNRKKHRFHIKKANFILYSSFKNNTVLGNIFVLVALIYLIVFTNSILSINFHDVNTNNLDQFTTCIYIKSRKYLYNNFYSGVPWDLKIISRAPPRYCSKQYTVVCGVGSLLKGKFKSRFVKLNTVSVLHYSNLSRTLVLCLKSFMNSCFKVKNKSGTMSTHKCRSATASENAAKRPPNSIIYNIIVWRVAR
jgi:hypothetical protein